MSDAMRLPREELDDWMRVRRTGPGTHEAVREDHFGETQCGDLLARCALAVLAERGARGLGSLRADWLGPAPPGAPLALRTAPLGAGPGNAPLAWEVRASAAGGELRRVTVRPDVGAPRGPSYQDAPLPLRRGAPADPDRAQAAPAFLACFYAHWEFERRLGERFVYERFAPLAHDVQIHRAARPDGWLLLRAHARIAARGRALGARELFARDGALLASVACEASIGEG
jgi:hypothetical protein